eukprot:2298049-Pyramimonas_sp.AAC.1
MTRRSSRTCAGGPSIDQQDKLPTDQSDELPTDQSTRQPTGRLAPPQEPIHGESGSSEAMSAPARSGRPERSAIRRVTPRRKMHPHE